MQKCVRLVPQNRLQIPKQFDLLGRTWKVLPMTAAREKAVIKENKYDKEDELLGFCSKDESRIYLKPGQSVESTMHTFLHELGHAIIHLMGWEFTEEDEERFVDLLGGMLHQFLKSKKGNFRRSV